MRFYALRFSPFPDPYWKRDEVSAEDLCGFSSLWLMIAASGSKFCGPIAWFPALSALCDSSTVCFN